MDFAKTAPSAGSGRLVYCRRAMGVSKTLVLLVSLAVVACLLVVPVLPEKETAHAGLETTTVDNTGRLLGENSPQLNPPD